MLFRLQIIEDCASTNMELLAKRGQTDFHGLALLAHKQSKGQGRRGRSWLSGEGNLALSLALSLSPSEVSLLPFRLGLSFVESLSLSREDICLKWPNDVYLHNKKLAGILSIARQQGENVDVVIGLGANLQSAPSLLESDVQAACLRDLGISIDSVSLAQKILRRMEENLSLSFVDLKERWEKWARMGTAVSIVGEAGTFVMVGILPSGELEVHSDAGVRFLSSEEVSLRFSKMK